MEQLHILDGDPPEDDLTPPILGASHYSELGDFLGLLECLALLAYQVDRTGSTELLDPDEARVLAQIEAFQVAELALMHHTLVSSELALSAFFLDMSGVHACCRASEFRQRRRLMELLSAIQPGNAWALKSEWATIDGQATLYFTHQRSSLPGFISVSNCIASEEIRQIT